MTESGFVFGNFVDGTTRGAFRWYDGVLTVLPGLGGTSDVAADVNERGQVVGRSTTADGEQHAVLWQPDGGVVDLGTTGQDSEATGINLHGDIVGAVRDAAGTRAVIWRDGVAAPLLDLAQTDSTPAGHPAINDQGEVVVLGFTAVDPTTDDRRVYLWDDGAARELAVPHGLRDADPVAVNAQGVVLGQALDSALLWNDDGSVTVLPGLGGATTVANGLSDRGEVVGQAQTAAGTWHAFVYRDGAMVDLGRVFDRGDAAATAVNGRGQVVGRAGGDTRGDGSRAVLWDDGDVVQLGGLDERAYASASDINDRGQIVGTSADTAGVEHAVMWTLTDEAPSDVSVTVHHVAPVLLYRLVERSGGGGQHESGSVKVTYSCDPGTSDITDVHGFAVAGSPFTAPRSGQAVPCDGRRHTVELVVSRQAGTTSAPPGRFEDVDLYTRFVLEPDDQREVGRSATVPVRIRYVGF